MYKIALPLLFLILIVSLSLAIWEKSNEVVPYKLLGEGTFDRVEYSPEGLITSPITIIYFTEGGTCVLNGMRSIPLVKGKYVFIYQHGYEPYIFTETKRKG